MRERASTGPASGGRGAIRAAALCAGIFALLTCKPPDFTPIPTGDPLAIAPREPTLTAGMAFTFVASGGTPPYTYTVVGTGTINSAGTYTAPAAPTTDTVRVDDYEGERASTIVVVSPSQLWMVPTDVTVPANTSITFQGRGGTPSYTYTKVGGVGSIHPTTGVYSSAVGGTAQIRVTDSATVAQSVTTNVQVAPPANPLTISPASAVLETNVELQFNASGGTGGYTYEVVPGGKGSITTGGLYSSGTTAGSATVRVSDSSSTTTDATVTINPPPPPLTLTPTSATIPPNGTQAFTAAGGTTPYTFTLDPASPGGGTLTGSGGSRTYTAPSTGGLVSLTVTDGRGRTASAPIFVTDALGITPSSTTIQVDGTVNLLATGGSGSYTAWDVISGPGDITFADGETATYTAGATPGDAVVRVTDSVTSYAYCYITVTADPLFIIPTTITLQTGTAITFTASGGEPYTFSRVSGVGSITAGGEYSSSDEGLAVVRVTDNYGRTQDASVTVNPPPLALSPSAISIQAGSAVTFAAEGGTPPYAFSKVSGVGSINGTTGVYTSSTEGTASVKVTDSKARTDTASVTVTAPPAPPLNLTPVAVNVQTGTDQTFSVAGGVAPYTWSVVEGPSGGTINSAGVYTAPTNVVPSPTVYTVRVSDSTPAGEGGPQVLTAAVKVYAPLAISPKPATVDAGTQVDFTASGGISPYTFSSPTGLGTLTAVDADTVHYAAPGLPGVETIRVTDSLLKTADATFNVVDPAAWGTKQPIDASKKSGQHASLALNPATASQPYAPQIAYWEAQGKDLKLAKWTGTSWSLSTVDSNNGGDKYASLALDDDGHARVAWYDADSGKKDLRYREWNGSSWNGAKDVDTSGDVGQYASLALDGTGSPGIAYYDATNKDLKFKRWDGSIWTWADMVVDDVGDVGQFASLAFDSADRPRIAYYDVAGTLKYAAWNGSMWTVEVVDSGTGVGQFASLEIGSGDVPSIAYYDGGGKDLRWVRRDAGIWGAPVTIDSTGDVGQYASLALDPGDSHPLVAYYDLTNGNLKYAELVGDVWVIGTVDNAANNVGQFASLAVNAAGLMRIAYYNATSTVQDLLYIEEQ